MAALIPPLIGREAEIRRAIRIQKRARTTKPEKIDSHNDRTNLRVVSKERTMVDEASTTAVAVEEDQYNGAALNARELEWAVNSPELIAAHKKVNGNIVRTRFPPEPNGYVRSK